MRLQACWRNWASSNTWADHGPPPTPPFTRLQASGQNRPSALTPNQVNLNWTLRSGFGTTQFAFAPWLVIHRGMQLQPNRPPYSGSSSHCRNSNPDRAMRCSSHPSGLSAVVSFRSLLAVSHTSLEIVKFPLRSPVLTQALVQVGALPSCTRPAKSSFFAPLQTRNNLATTWLPSPSSRISSCLHPRRRRWRRRWRRRRRRTPASRPLIIRHPWLSPLPISKAPWVPVKCSNEQEKSHSD